ncbi:hypothetical protein J4G48_0031760 [Bradyrhizobium barranii subsp. apii]|uniref:hypothetical protein n=1 Tax=Bradyrhizobium barranii TaxID=2992140 RepID=UPI001AA17A75|nr:hypothetical protein [Bradyrhizobium barranii]UPT93889.1 hypothetical protein J4G48_0031760 [Bradyrhizobium barranii subsp. apii]
MPETVGLLILSTIGATTSVTGIGTAAVTLEIAGATFSAASIVGSAAIIGASIGLQYALSNPDVPKPENGAQPLKQSVPSRQRGYWTNRLSGYYLLFLGAGGDSQDMLAFHSGPIESVLQLYLHDQPVSTIPALTHDAVCVVQSVGADAFLNCVTVQAFYGYDTQNVNGIINASNTSGVWTSDFAGKGIACLAMYCQSQVDPSVFTKRYPQGLPLPSVLAKCAPVWDPRDPAQSRDNRSTWRASPNPVLQLIDYLTEPDGGMGLEIDDILLPAVLAQWMDEADLCDGRYYSAGFYRFDNSPESVINKILASCDGWLCEAGDGTLSLTVGVYREPIDAPLTAKHILGWSINRGIAYEELVNQLDVTYTNPAAGYVADQIDSVRDEDLISRIGEVRAKPLDLSWVQDAWQANLLAERAMLRLNASGGTFVTDLYGLRYLGRRWIPVQFPEVAGLEDCVVEIQDRAKVDLLAGQVTFNWKLVDRDALAALGAATPALIRQDGTYYRRHDDTVLVRQN